ncbi:hypothetical protein V502_05276 [Pseudogymnoascus sp. VKM F-4520 (FW-2644)]|nr:hypothetical protein V502_05276 [Pseudogymnoascus sp. VKM F-4520 (FW-2644)]
MAQKGGTYRIPAGVGVATPSESSSHARNHNGGKIDGQESAVNKSGDTSRISDGTNVAARSESSSHARSQDDGKSDGQQWEVLTNSEADNETDSHARSVSSHFDAQIGWGRWKFTLFSLDMNIKKHAPGSTQR